MDDVLADELGFVSTSLGSKLNSLNNYDDTGGLDIDNLTDEFVGLESHHDHRSDPWFFTNKDYNCDDLLSGMVNCDDSILLNDLIGTTKGTRSNLMFVDGDSNDASSYSFDDDEESVKSSQDSSPGSDSSNEWLNVTRSKLKDKSPDFIKADPDSISIKSEKDEDFLVTEDDFIKGEEEAPFPIATITIDTTNQSSGAESLLASPIHQSIDLHNYSCSKSPTSFNSATKGSSNFKSNTKNNRSSQPTSANSSPSARKTPKGCRGKQMTDLILTDEEKRLLTKEGYEDFPIGSNTPLTKQEEKILRKVRRKIRNKRSAQCSRQRKKEYVEDLEKRFEVCRSENDGLRKEVGRLKRENESMLVKMKKLLQFGTSNGQASFKTSFFVLIFSFLLVLVPYFRPPSMDDNLINIMEKDVVGTGRHLLMTLSSNDIIEQSEGFYHTSNVSDPLMNYTESILY